MDDGAILFVQYFGVLEMNETVQDALANGTATDFDHQYFRTTPRFEVSDPNYAWLQSGPIRWPGPRNREGSASSTTCSA